jgi:hypothetical protein
MENTWVVPQSEDKVVGRPCSHEASNLSRTRKDTVKKIKVVPGGVDV